MAKDEGWGRRLRTARRAYEERHDGGLTYDAIGEKLGKLLKRPAFKHSTVRAWFVDGQEPDSFVVATALATVLEEDAGYLITGHRKAPAEAEAEDFTVGAVALTPAQKARAVETAAETERTRRASESARLKRRRSNGEP